MNYQLLLLCFLPLCTLISRDPFFLPHEKKQSTVLTIIGIMAADEQCQAIVQKDGAQICVHPGSIIDQWRVTTIDDEGITLEKNGTTLRLYIKGAS